MSFMFEVYYHPPANSAKETALTGRVKQLGGRLDFREEPTLEGLGGICLAYEFDDLETANTAATALRQLGEHVEGPCNYGP